MASERRIPAEVTPHQDKVQEAAKRLQDLGFRVLHIGRTISVEAPAERWRAIFGVTFATQQKQQRANLDEMTTFEVPTTESVSVPSDLQDLVADVAFTQPPEFF